MVNLTSMVSGMLFSLGTTGAGFSAALDLSAALDFSAPLDEDDAVPDEDDDEDCVGLTSDCVDSSEDDDSEDAELPPPNKPFILPAIESICITHYR